MTKIIETGRRRAINKCANLLVSAADADFQRTDFYFIIIADFRAQHGPPGALLCAREKHRQLALFDSSNSVKSASWVGRPARVEFKLPSPNQELTWLRFR
jgi:hypothetical protein